MLKMQILLHMMQFLFFSINGTAYYVKRTISVITAFLCPKSTDIFCPQITGIAAG